MEHVEKLCCPQVKKQRLASANVLLTDVGPVLYKYWHARMVFATGILVDRESAVHSTEVGSTTDLSLVALRQPADEFALRDSRVVLVSWLLASSRSGRCVHLDDDEAVYSMPKHHPPRCFADEEIVHPAVGTALRKDKALRSRIPEQILHLQNMWEDALRVQSAAALRVTFDPCFVCEKLDDECVNCALCQASAHPACLDVVCLKFSGKLDSLREVDLALPAVFCVQMEGRDPLCALCAKVRPRCRERRPRPRSRPYLRSCQMGRVGGCASRRSY